MSSLRIRLCFLCALALLLCLLPASCSNVLAPERPPLLIEGLKLPPGTVIKRRRLAVISEYPRDATVPRELERMSLHIVPPGNFDELTAHFEGQLSGRGFSAEAPERTDYDFGLMRTQVFWNAEEKFSVKLDFQRYEAGIWAPGGVATEYYTMEITSGEEE